MKTPKKQDKTKDIETKAESAEMAKKEAHAAAPQARWLGSPDEHMADWENRHLSAPVFRREYDALRRAFDSMFKAGGEDNLPKPEWWDKYAPAFVWLMAHGGGGHNFDELIDVVQAEVVERFLPRLHDYTSMLSHPRVLARMDGQTAYAVKKVLAAIRERRRK